jgi:NTE family protein
MARSSALAAPTHPAWPAGDANEGLALVLGGGGARGAYQAGVLRGIGRRFPELRLPILTGISAGAVNAVQLASHPGPPRQAAEDLARLWLELTPEKVYDVATLPVIRNVAAWGARLVSGGRRFLREPMRGMVDTSPLRAFLNGVLEHAPDGSLPGIARNIEREALRAVALSAVSYTTGRSVTWVEGRDVDPGQRLHRRTEVTRLTAEHVMASCALPMLFPAIRIGEEWFGDGGVGLSAPLSPALHLGATRILTISTRHRRLAETRRTVPSGYPPPAQILGVLYNAAFSGIADSAVARLEKVNRLLARLPPDQRNGMRLVEILVLHPSRDLARIAREFEPRLPPLIRHLTRGWGTREAASPDVLSLILFQADYLRRLVEVGEADAETQADRIEAFLTAGSTLVR